MATEASAPPSGRPRPWLLVLLAVAVAAYIVTQMFSGGAAAPPVSTTPAARGQARGAGAKPGIEPSDLDVKIEALKQEAPQTEEGDRNPFRFAPKAPPPAPSALPPAVSAPPPPPVNTGPPPPPPIGNTIKFIGIVETGKARVGAFSDCKATFAGKEGEILEGRYRIVRIGVESAILEYLDGSGRTTIPLNGQACVVR